MGSNISSLGIGSGVLTADVIDQLKEADTSRIVKPLENKITLNNQKQDAYKLLDSLMKTFKASASALSYDTIFDSKSVKSSGKAEVKVDAGSTVESFSLETVALAKKDITKFGSVATPASTIASGAGVLKINNFEIPYDGTTTLSALAQSITEIAGSSVSASVLQTGNGSYNLVLSSKSTGASQAISVSDTDDGTAGAGSLNAALFDPYNAITNPNGYEKVQTASDATFKYNGIAMTRATNEVSDLILGVNIKLKQEGDFSLVDISQDSTAISDELKLFTDSYNALIANLHDMTLKDEATGAEGIFNGNSFVKSISRDLTRTITSLNTNNNSLINYGIDIDRSGKMSFNKATLETKLKEDPDAVKLFFTGGTNSEGNKVTGFFTTVDEKLKSYTGYGNLLSNFETDLKNEGKSLSKNHAAAKASLDTRYEIMAKRFTAYDGMISRINSQFSSLQMMIDAEANN
ncbi:Flagellar hook-associated protein 2-like protein [Sulfurimonas denitrificans DSM 1251]|uniref:Flagellar hook-associated protein 2 n=1 Tax=Sulfurimonas denitrificans (strain ATCC 33889 / DSM 1251) TaxID=326298 RepID=Q30U48_SULDN|nr:flagellar filament capping protein FliD [Sulfurimonas denitrificans]ABB43483.1 Flagellar hook-associated protein 2-like protein [Sulfurimonas denitrificans DSM 1251]MDD3443316.1 flagellar filament capping protein FliD [Sulfurimonas denitrificans]